MTSFTWLGDPIAGVHPRGPEIVLWGAANTPVVAWVEDPNYIFFAKWEPGPPAGWQPYQISPSGTIGRLRMGVFGDTLYIAFQLDQGSQATSIILCKFENFSTWSSQTVPLANSNPANVSFHSLAVYEGKLVWLLSTRAFSKSFSPPEAAILRPLTLLRSLICSWGINGGCCYLNARLLLYIFTFKDQRKVWL